MIEKRSRCEFSTISVDCWLSQQDSACQQKQRFGSLRCEPTRSHDVTSENNKNRPPDPPKTVKNCASEPIGRSFRSTSASQAARASGPGGPGERPRRPKRPRRLAGAFRLARSAARSGPARARPPSWTSWQASLGNIVIDIIYIYIYIGI